jgi:hypothetical protein
MNKTMTDFKTALLDVLAEIKGSGSFVSNGVKSNPIFCSAVRR